MANSVCGVCHEKEVDHRCIQCHKPVCDDDAFKDDQGIFCGRECSAQYRSYDQADARVARARSHGLGNILIVLVIIAAIVYLARLKEWGPLAKQTPPGEHGIPAETTGGTTELPGE
jgi:hypothetical protein